MHLLAILILYLEISYTFCRSVRHKHHSDNTQPPEHQADNSNGFLYLRKPIGRELDTHVIADRAYGDSEDYVSGKEANKRRQEIQDISKLENSEMDSNRMFNSKKQSRKINDAEHDKDMDSKFNREKSYFLTEDNEVDKSVERYMKNFYFDMITLFQYEIKEFAEKEAHIRQQRKKHRKPSLRPKRSIRSLLKDVHIKDILMRYFQQKQKEENGKPLLRYG